MFLRSINSSCRLCGSSFHFVRKSMKNETRGSYVCTVVERRFSEKIRDSKDFTRYSGRPDDISKKKKAQKWQQRPESDCEQLDPAKKDSKKTSDVTNPNKWSGRPDATCERKSVGSQQKTGGSAYEATSDSCKSNEGAKGGEKFGSKASFAILSGTPICNTGKRGSIMSSVVHLTPSPKPDVLPPPLCESRAPQGTKIPSHLESTHRLPQLTANSVTPHIKENPVKNSTPASIIERPMNALFATPIGNLDVQDVSGSNQTGFRSGTIPVSGILNKPQEVTVDVVEGIQNPVDAGCPQKAPESEGGPERKRPSRPLHSPGKPRVDIKLNVRNLKIHKDTFDEKRRHRVYSFGLAETGALGFFKPNEMRRWRKYIGRPFRHQFAEENRVISAECGYGFTLFYVKSDDNVKLYGCGLNTDFQLGATSDDVITYPSPIDIHMNSPNTKIVSFSAGRAHSVVATDNEGVFLFGSNSYGQCGRAMSEEDTFEEDCTITQIKSFSGEKVVTVQCGQDHTCFITESGKVYTCGWGTDGQTGLGHTAHVCEPSLVQGEIGRETIVKVASRCDTVLALNDKGELFGWGSNEFRQIKDDRDLPQVDSPFRMKHINEVCGKVVDIAAGSSFCLVLNQDGEVYVWGDGILGGGPELMKTTRPALLPNTLFGTNDYQPNAHPARVYCGLDHMVVVNNLKHAYAWGRNKHGCLGIGTGRDQYFPYKLALSANAIHVSCAVDHSVIVTDHAV